MQKQGNSFYKWQVIENMGQFLSLKDLLGTATLSKEYNLILKKYIKQHYSLSNQQNHTQFQQLRSLFNRKIYIYNKKDKFARPHPSNFIIRNIQCQQIYSVVETLDRQYKLITTSSLILEQMAEMTPLSHAFRFVRITDGSMLYCAEMQKITRFNLGLHKLTEGETLVLKGEVEDLICGYRYAIAVVRQTPEQVKLRIFDSNQKFQNFKDVETPFTMAKFKIEDHLAMGKNANYFIFHQTLYEFNIKTGSINQHPDFVGKKIVKIFGGKNHFMVYERTSELSVHWNTDQVIKFAQEEGFEDFVKIFKVEKVTGKVLLGMDKKYMEEVLGIENVKIQQKLMLKLQECNKENPDDYVVYGWGRAGEGQLGTNPSKEVTKPIKIKLPNDCEMFKLSGNYTFILNKKAKSVLVNGIDQKTNKLQWKEVTNRKVWALSAVDESVILIASAAKEKISQRESESVVDQKKEKLRTAKNIIDKITWDQNLHAQQFKVGYLDKYDGILQIPFKELQQSQVKQYRIEYFKQGGQVVWDKKKRIDIL